MGKTPTKNPGAMSDGRLEGQYQVAIREIKDAKTILMEMNKGIYVGKTLKSALIDITKRQARHALRLKKEMIRRNEWCTKNGKTPKFKI